VERTGRQRSGSINRDRGPPFTNTLARIGGAMIEVDRDEFDQITAIRAEGEPLHSDERTTQDITFEICKDVEGDMIMLNTIPIRLRKAGDDRVTVDFDDSGTRKYWDGKIGFKTYMEAKKAVVEDRSAEIKDVAIDIYEDDGAWIHLNYSAEVTAEKLKTAVELAEQTCRD
jgi:hypothetical protein